MTGVTKEVKRPGNGTDKAESGDMIAMDYIGRIQKNLPDGPTFDTSVGRGDFKVAIGTGKVIPGWDKGITGEEGGEPMTLGEVATLTISPEYGYGSRGFGDVIPPNSTLVFMVQLKGITKKGGARLYYDQSKYPGLTQTEVGSFAA